MEFLGYKIGNGYTHLDYDKDGFLVGDMIMIQIVNLSSQFLSMM